MGVVFCNGCRYLCMQDVSIFSVSTKRRLYEVEISKAAKAVSTNLLP